MGEPNWNDVSFDDAAADRAISQCQTAIDTLEGVKTEHTPARTTATGGSDQTWTGNHRQTFDTDATALVGDVDDCITNLTSLKSAIADAKQDAADTQSARESARREWCRLHPDDEHC